MLIVGLLLNDGTRRWGAAVSIAQLGNGRWAKWRMGMGLGMQVVLSVVNRCGVDPCFEKRSASILSSHYGHLSFSIFFYFRSETDCYLSCRLARERSVR